MNNLTEFGLAHVKCEGGGVHPDDIDRDLTDEQYLRQLHAYARHRGIEQTQKEFCLRPELLEKLRWQSL